MAGRATGRTRRAAPAPARSDDTTAKAGEPAPAPSDDPTPQAGEPAASAQPQPAPRRRRTSSTASRDGGDGAGIASRRSSDPQAARYVMHRGAELDAADVNPLRQGTRLERVPDPCLVVIFGATGDLSHRKILPAFYNLRRAGLLPAETSIVGYSRRPYSDTDFAAEMRQAVTEHSRNRVESALWEDFADTIHYQQGDFKDPAAYTRLAERLDQIDSAMGCRGNRLFYLATPPSAYEDIVANLGAAGLADRTGSWSRIVIEKPFGHDLASGRQLNDSVMSVFDESQVYRIDHYLGKETVQNLLVFRFANGIFEPVWNRRYVDHVQITVAEDLGVEGRGAYYEEAGASRDILQNHMLQLLSLVAMEPPIDLEADALRDEKQVPLRRRRYPEDRQARRQDMAKNKRKSKEEDTGDGGKACGSLCRAGGVEGFFLQSGHGTSCRI